MKVLIIGVSGTVSNGIQRILEKNLPEIELVISCVSPIEDTGNHIFELCPFANNSLFIPWIKKIVKKYGINVICSGVEEVLSVLSEHKLDLQEELKVEILVENYDLVNLFQNKWNTYKWFKERRLPFPKTIEYISKNEVKVFMDKCPNGVIFKPIKGKGSKGVHYFPGFADFDKKVNFSGGDYIVQEYIGNLDSEFTVGCYRRINKKLELIILKRLIENGNTVEIEVVNDLAISDYCQKIVELINPEFPINLQIRKNENGVPFCFEVNLRISGSCVFRDMLGFKDVFSVFSSLLDRKDYNSFPEIIPGQKGKRLLREALLIDGKWTFYD